MNLMGDNMETRLLMLTDECGDKTAVFFGPHSCVRAIYVNRKGLTQLMDSGDQTDYYVKESPEKIMELYKEAKGQ